MPRYQVLRYIRIRIGPSSHYESVGEYYEGEIINSGGYPFYGDDGNMWVSYTAYSGATRYVCYSDGFTRYLTEI